MVEQRPLFDWSRTNESCVQHTRHDIEQIEQLYSMCKQSLINYCYNRHKSHSNSTNTTSLSPMNLLVVTLWHVKHYHSERYIATELNFAPSTVHHILSEVIDILHLCVYPKLVSLPANLTNRNTTHGPEDYHKLIVDSTFIAVPQPDGSQ